KTAVILLHGYGANAQDLAPLASALKTRSPLRFYFPNAPRSPRELAAFGGRAWFASDMMLLQRRAQDPFSFLYDEAHVQKLYEATDKHLWPYVVQKASQYENIVLGGFSQGAMLALDCAWRHSLPQLKGLMLFSGAWAYLERP